MENFDEISKFVDSHEPELREIVGDLIEEDFFLDRLTENQECALRWYYVDCKTDDEIAQKLNIDLGDALKLQDSAIEEIRYLGRLCDIENIFEEENLVEKLKKGHEEILEYMKYFEEKFGVSESKARELLRDSQRIFFSQWYIWKKNQKK